MKPRQILNRFLAQLNYKLFKLKPGRPNGLNFLDDLKTLLPEEGPWMFFDVGGNRGQTVLGLKREYPNAHIRSFEPCPEAFRSLSAIIEYHCSIQAFPLAMGQQRGKALLNVSAISEASSLLTFDRELAAQHTVHQTEVVMETVDSFCSEHRIESVDLLKIDTQGYDLNVLQGAYQMLLRGGVGVIYCEVIFSPMYVGQPSLMDFEQFLSPLGYRLLGFYHQAQKGRYLSHCDAAWVAPRFLHQTTGQAHGSGQTL